MKHDYVTHDSEPPTPLDVLVGMVSKTMEDEYIGAMQAFTIRMELVDACTLEALAAYSGQSRNKIACQLIKSGLHELWQRIGDDERAEIERTTGALIRQRVEAGATENGEG